MAKKKATNLTLDILVVREAKRVAESEGTTVSAIVEAALIQRIRELKREARLRKPPPPTTSGYVAA